LTREIDPQTVRRIARLSRIELADRQVEPLCRQMGSIIEYFDKLQQLDTSNVEPLVHAVEKTNVFGSDQPEPSLSPDQAMANAPHRDGNFYKVPKVIGDSL